MAAQPFFPSTRDLPASTGRRIADGILNLLYPEACFICAEVYVARQRECGVCEKCWQNLLLLRIQRPWCPSCGLPTQQFDPTEPHLCSDCISRLPPYSGARSYGYYTAELSRLVQGFKFEGRRNLAGLLAPLLAATFCETWDHRDFDTVVPVPLHSRRKRERGYNQAALLGRSLSLLTGIPCAERVLGRTKMTVPQVGLSDSERLQNVRNAFRCESPGLVENKRLLLVDDVMTTGATVASAAQALMNAGALKVSVITVARAVGG